MYSSSYDTCFVSQLIEQVFLGKFFTLHFIIDKLGETLPFFCMVLKSSVKVLTFDT